MALRILAPEGAAISSSVVRLAGVTKRYAGLTVVNKLDLDVREGEFLTFLGPSGCGKTTTLRMISGFELVDEGTVFIGGQIANELPPFRRSVNTVFQNYALFPHLSAFDNIAYGPSVQGLTRSLYESQVYEMLERVGLPDKAKSFPHQLSGGQMQRIALARALINRPRVLLLDEPLSALDAKLRRSMQLELKRMQASLGITFIYVTHDQEEALVMSDRVAVMNAGRLEHLGSPSEVFEKPATLFAADFLGVGNLLPGKVTEKAKGRIRITINENVSLYAAQANGHSIGDNVIVAIRAEKVSMQPGLKTEINAIRGELKEVIYAGASVRLTFTISGGGTIQVACDPHQIDFDFRSVPVGSPFTLSVPVNAVLIYAH